MKRLFAIWEVLPPETRQKILDNYPWLLVAGLAMAAACYFGACRCRGKREPKPDAQPAPVVASLFPGAVLRRAVLRGDDDPAYREALRRAEQRWRERAARKTGTAAQSCPDCCGCGRCGEQCQCLVTGRVCGSGCTCVVCTDRCKDESKGWQTAGVDTDRLADRPRFFRQGKEIGREEAMRLVEGDVPDDAGKPRLTIIGPEADRKKVLAALDQPPLSELKGRFVVQAYDPSDWAVRNYGFVTSGKPTIYLQMPGGKVLHRQDTYTTAEDLAAALRKADPGYQPSKDPDARKPALPGMPDLSQIPVPVWIGGALVLLMVFGRKGGQ